MKTKKAMGINVSQRIKSLLSGSYDYCNIEKKANPGEVIMQQGAKLHKKQHGYSPQYTAFSKYLAGSQDRAMKPGAVPYNIHKNIWNVEFPPQYLTERVDPYGKQSLLSKKWGFLVPNPLAKSKWKGPETDIIDKYQLRHYIPNINKRDDPRKFTMQFAAGGKESDEYKLLKSQYKSKQKPGMAHYTQFNISKYRSPTLALEEKQRSHVTKMLGFYSQGNKIQRTKMKELLARQKRDDALRWVNDYDAKEYKWNEQPGPERSAYTPGQYFKENVDLAGTAYNVSRPEEYIHETDQKKFQYKMMGLNPGSPQHRAFESSLKSLQSTHPKMYKWKLKLSQDLIKYKGQPSPNNMISNVWNALDKPTRQRYINIVDDRQEKINLFTKIDKWREGGILSDAEYSFIDQQSIKNSAGKRILLPYDMQGKEVKGFSVKHYTDLTPIEQLQIGKRTTPEQLEYIGEKVEILKQKGEVHPTVASNAITNTSMAFNLTGAEVQQKVMENVPKQPQAAKPSGFNWTKPVFDSEPGSIGSYATPANMAMALLAMLFLKNMGGKGGNQQSQQYQQPQRGMYESEY